MSDWFGSVAEKLGEIPVSAWISVAALIILGALILIMRKKSFSARLLSIGALCVAASFLLSYIPLFKMPYGGTVTPASMLPIIAYGFAFGPAAGISAGIVYGCLQMLQGVYFVHPVQFLLDYILPFALLGVSGFFNKKYFLLAILTSGFSRFLMHYLSGVVFWGSYAPEGQPVWLYSLIYNGSYMLPEAILCMALGAIPGVRKALLSMGSKR